MGLPVLVLVRVGVMGTERMYTVPSTSAEARSLVGGFALTSITVASTAWSISHESMGRISRASSTVAPSRVLQTSSKLASRRAASCAESLGSSLTSSRVSRRLLG